MKLHFFFASVVFLPAGLFIPSGSASSQDGLDAAQLQRRMHDEQLILERKQTSAVPETQQNQKLIDERARLVAEQRQAQTQLQQRQLQLRSATANTPRNSDIPAQINQSALQNQMFARERQDQDFSFDIQRQQLQIKRRYSQ